MADESASDRPLSERVRDLKLIEQALRSAVRDALLRHKQAGNPIAVWRDGAVVWIAPEDIQVDGGLKVLPSRRVEMTKGSKITFANRPGGIEVSDSGFLQSSSPTLGGVWSGAIARLRIYHSTKTVFAYKSPGANADAVGFTDDPNLIHALFLARDNGRVIFGFTNNDGSIGLIDY